MKRNHVSTGKNVAALVLGLLVMSGVAQAKGWTGGDDLPTSPLACDATPANVAAKPYDGGTVKNARWQWKWTAARNIGFRQNSPVRTAHTA